jgi:hypothetical protein
MLIAGLRYSFLLSAAMSLSISFANSIEIAISLLLVV